ncbi:MAG: invasion associated locus B family protein [Paracoccaceae bacterium]|jgi:invasion protein IalB|nr:invasion associated locus B family protein [Paracoccaceae bacterium]
MILRSVFAVAISTALMAVPSIAQEEAQPEPEITYEGLAVGTAYFRDTFTDWRLRCQKTVDGNDPCQLFQLLADETGGTVAQIVVFNLNTTEGPAVAGANVTVPLETALREGIRLQVDDNPAKAYPFAYCDDIGCHARLGLTAVELKAMQDGSAARLVTVPYRGERKPVIVQVSLQGFTAGYKAVVENNQP